MSSSPAPYLRSPSLLNRQESRLLIVDMQDRILPVIHNGDLVLANCVRLVEGAQLLQVPVSATEQYPKGLGPTTAALARQLPDRLEKLRFSSAEVLNWGLAAEDSTGRFRVVVAGIETHVCILQTVFDLLSAGFEVHVPADAVGSRSESNRQVALDRMALGGAVITTTESVLLEWCEVAGTPDFKQISQMIR
ncbi:MAG TPA: isochorismatase [Planctomycetaceae bacterium]|jgi:nicotinamidase-related amidase|nr:isochorismatase [Planctomycetaceae bacterium]